MDNNILPKSLTNLRSTFDAIDRVVAGEETEKNLQKLIWLMSQELTGKNHMKDWQTAKLYLLTQVTEIVSFCDQSQKQRLLVSLEKATHHPDSYAANALITKPNGLALQQSFALEEPNLAKRALKKLAISS